MPNSRNKLFADYIEARRIFIYNRFPRDLDDTKPQYARIAQLEEKWIAAKSAFYNSLGVSERAKSLIEQHVANRPYMSPLTFESIAQKIKTPPAPAAFKPKISIPIITGSFLFFVASIVTISLFGIAVFPIGFSAMMVCIFSFSTLILSGIGFFDSKYRNETATMSYEENLKIWQDDGVDEKYSAEMEPPKINRPEEPMFLKHPYRSDLSNVLMNTEVELPLHAASPQ